MSDHKEEKKIDLVDLHKLALKQFQNIQDNERDQREKSVEDRKFCDSEDGQWDDNAKEKRKNRPRYTINKVAPIIDQVIGDQRQTETSAKVRPLKAGMKKTADILTGLIRDIEQKSQAKGVYDHGFDEKLKGGYGGWRVITKRNEDDIFKQEIEICQIDSADTSLFFGPSVKYDKRDSKYAFLVKSVSITDFKAEYPNATLTGFDVDVITDQSCKVWFSQDSMLIAEYWVKQEYKTMMGLLSDGRVINMEEEKDVLDELAKAGIEVVDQQEAELNKVICYKMNGAEIYEDPKEFASKYIPLVPDYGHITNIEGKTYVRGMIRFAKDSNRIYNYLVSTDIETQALTPKDPYWYTPKQVDGYKTEYEQFAVNGNIFMPFNPDELSPGPPTRTGSPSVNMAAAEAIRRASMDIDASMGFFGPAKGDAPQLLSEKSIISQAEKGDRGIYLFVDNHLKSKQYTYDILIDMIPRIYDTQQQIRILGADGLSEDVMINETVRDEQSGEDVIVNDLSLGKYGVIATNGPAFATKRQETTEQLIKLADSLPVFAEFIPDLVAKNLDVNESEEMFTRIREAMIQAGTVKPTDDEVKELGLDKPRQPSEEEIALKDNVLMQTEQLKSTIELNDKKADTEDKNKLLKATQAYKELMEAFKVQKELGIEGGISEKDLMTAQQGILQITQDQSVEIEAETLQPEQQELPPIQ